jgi:3-hydroxyacyl-CoA dehydrogenase
MKYTERLQNVTVLGAAGKMGSGILLLTALEMADLSLKPENKGMHFILNAMDVSSEALGGLMKYLRTQVLKAAEKKIVALRKVYENRADLIDNSEIINQYVEDVMVIVRPSTRIEVSFESLIIFEAIKEDPSLKVKILSYINENNSKSPWFCSNTSSIPINELDSKANLGGRILGVHFYNPPAIQKLVELIKTEQTNPDLVEFIHNFAKNLKKIIVPSNDFAGFIGNGHFMRDALHGISEVEKLSPKFSFPESVYMINKITQDYLIRPMGIFQLIDYVGIDVCQYIMSVMNPYLDNEELYSPLLDKMLEIGVRGGQNSDGTQKDGFLKYDKSRPVAIYDINKNHYVLFSELQSSCDEKLGKLPSSVQTWKTIVGSKSKDELLKNYFNELKKHESFGAEIARNYAIKSKAIGLKLVSDKVASSENDVNTVLLNGFYHAYGPINDYI